MSQTPQSETPGIKVVGKRGSARAYVIRDFLQRSDVPFEWRQVQSDEEAVREAGVGGVHDSRLPVCIFPDGARLECPTVRQITEKLGWLHDPSRTEYDVAIYGAGPAGLSAAVYAASEGLRTIVLERYAVGGQAGSSSAIENYLGFPKGISGAELAERAREQACRFGAEILVGRAGIRGEFTPGRGIGYLEDGTRIAARASICATGISYRRLGLPNEEKFFGAGVYYGAGSSEAALCASEDVYVVGGGNSAGQAAMHFSRFARRVAMVVRDASLKSTLSHYLIDRIDAAPNIRVLANTEVSALHGSEVLESVTLTTRPGGEQRDYPTHWLFVCIGGDPHTEWAKEAGLIRDEGGYLMTGPDLVQDQRAPQNWPLDRPPYYLETNVPGLFAAGDVRHGAVKRCASAVGEGAMAVTFVHRYLADT
jgi:thioredoxin reductase (NADPH)